MFVFVFLFIVVVGCIFVCLFVVVLGGFGLFFYLLLLFTLSFIVLSKRCCPSTIVCILSFVVRPETGMK